jgi:hypothetical protein
MKLLSVNLARSVWLGPLVDLNPKGISLFPLMFELLADTYKFKKLPSFPPPEEKPPAGFIFKFGEFTVDGIANPIEVSLTIHSDGLVADTTSSTDYSNAFLADALTRLSQIIGTPDYETIIKKKIYLSQIYVSTDVSLDSVNRKFKPIIKYLTDNVEDHDKVFEVGGLSFWPDQTSKVNPAPFRIERAVGVPFSEKRYYSEAPLPTDKHLELLDKLESILS